MTLAWTSSSSATSSSGIPISDGSGEDFVPFLPFLRLEDFLALSFFPLSLSSFPSLTIRSDYSLDEIMN